MVATTFVALWAYCVALVLKILGVVDWSWYVFLWPLAVPGILIAYLAILVGQFPGRFWDSDS